MAKIKCPHCGSEEGLEHTIFLKAFDLYTGDGKFDVEVISDMSPKQNKTMICRECGKRIMTYEEFIRDYFVEDD